MNDQPSINAVEMTRRIRDAHAERLREATREERLAFFNGAVRPVSGTPSPLDGTDAGLDLNASEIVAAIRETRAREDG